MKIMMHRLFVIFLIACSKENANRAFDCERKKKTFVHQNLAQMPNCLCKTITFQQAIITFWR